MLLAGLKLTANPKLQTKDFLRFLGVVVIIYIGALANRAALPSTRADFWLSRVLDDVFTAC